MAPPRQPVMFFCRAIFSSILASAAIQVVFFVVEMSSFRQWPSHTRWPMAMSAVDSTLPSRYIAHDLFTLYARSIRPSRVLAELGT